MRGFVVNGDYWNINVVSPGSPDLIDRTGVPRLATANPLTHTISIDSSLRAPLIDKVLLHEVAHAITMSRSILDWLKAYVPSDLYHNLEEWVAWFVENYSIEANVLASEALGRPLCVGGYCR